MSDLPPQPSDESRDEPRDEPRDESPEDPQVDATEAETVEDEVTRQFDPLDPVMILAGLVTFVFSFFAFYQLSALGVTDNFSAWHDLAGRGFLGWFGTILALVGALLVALSMISSQVRVPAVMVLGVFGAALILMFVAIFVHPLSGVTEGLCGTNPSPECQAVLDTVRAGHGAGFWAGFGLMVIATGVAAFKLAVDEDVV